jgi:hypothetical protein
MGGYMRKGFLIALFSLVGAVMVGLFFALEAKVHSHAPVASVINADEAKRNSEMALEKRRTAGYYELRKIVSACLEVSSKDGETKFTFPVTKYEQGAVDQIAQDLRELGYHVQPVYKVTIPDHKITEYLEVTW